MAWGGLRRYRRKLQRLLRDFGDRYLPRPCCGCVLLFAGVATPSAAARGISACSPGTCLVSAIGVTTITVVSVGVCQGRNVIADSVSLSNFELSERLPGSAWPWQNLWISISRPTLRPILMQTRKLSFPPFHLPHDLGSS